MIFNGYSTDGLSLIKVFLIFSVMGVIVSNSGYCSEFKYTASLGINSGGENIPIGDTSISSSSGMTLKFGGFIRPFKYFEIQSTIGIEYNFHEYESDTDDDSDTDPEELGDATIYRFPLELLLFARYEISEDQSIRLGFGPVLELSPTIKGDYDGTNFDLKADDTLGFVLQLDLVFGKEFIYFAGITATFIDYEYDNGTKVNGNNLNMHFGFNF